MNNDYSCTASIVLDVEVFTTQAFAVHSDSTLDYVAHWSLTIGPRKIMSPSITPGRLRGGNEGAELSVRHEE